MPEVDPVILQLRADVGRYNAEMQRTATRVTGLLGQQEKAAISLERTLGGLKGVLAGVSVAALAKSFLEIADAAKSLEARLRLATDGFGSFAQAQTDVRRIAADTRSGLEETANLYGNFSRGAKELGANQEAAARATETFSKTLKISGATANEASSATLQFGQALAAGALRGDELNSILEASPRLARLLTESLGKPIGEIKKLGEEGALTSDKLLAALTNKKFTDGIDAEFRQLPVTFDDAMTQVSNAAIITFGAFDRGGQFSTALANFITDGGRGFEELEQDALNMGIAIRSSLEGLGNAFDPLFDAARRFFEYVNGGAANIDIGRDIQKSLDQIDSASKWLGKNTYIGRVLKDNGVIDGSTNFGGRYRQAQQGSEKRRRGEIAEQNVNDLASRYWDQNGNPKSQPKPAAPRPAASGGGRKSSGASAARSAEAAERRAETERLRAIRDEAASASEAARFQDDITAAKAALAVATDDVLAFNLQSIESERSQRIADLETQKKLGELSDKEVAERSAYVNEIADLQSQRAQRTADEIRSREKLDTIAADTRNEQELLNAQASLAVTRAERRDIEMRLVELAYDQERAELEAVLASKEATQAQKDIATARLAILGQLQQYDNANVERRNESPIERRKREVSEMSANMNDELANMGLDAIDRGIDSISDKYIKLGGIAGDVINGLISDMIRLAAQQALFGGGAAGGGLFGAIGSLFGGGTPVAGARAKGGPVSAGKTYLVGEEGPELFTAPANGSITPNHQLAAGMAGVTAAGVNACPVQQTVVVKVEANDYFDAKVRQEAGGVAVQTGVAAAAEGRRAAGADAARAARRRIPGR